MIKFDDGFFVLPALHTDEHTNRLSKSDIRDLQDAHNVNQCDGNDETWFEGDNGACDHITIIDELEFWERYCD